MSRTWYPVIDYEKCINLMTTVVVHVGIKMEGVANG